MKRAAKSEATATEEKASKIGWEVLVLPPKWCRITLQKPGYGAQLSPKCSAFCRPGEQHQQQKCRRFLPAVVL